MKYAFPIRENPNLKIFGTEYFFPLHRIYCVGRNYADHAKEMGSNPEREPPFFFSKPADSVSPNGSQIPYPLATKNLHHEIELVVAIGKNGTRISKLDALNYVFGYGVGLDLTRRDLQGEAKKKGHPWSTAKGFDNSAPCSAVHKAEDVGHINQGTISLHVNGDMKQQGDISDMIWSVPEVISSLSSFFELCPGDLIFTGTPSGVGSLNRGDYIEGEIKNLDKLIISIV